ncbi:hypothetical protein C9F04_18580, partial [Salmonella enterica subsp. enterica serovar Wilhelmsburg]
MPAGGGKGAMPVGTSTARMLTEDQIKTTFADVAGCDEAKEEVAELFEYMSDPSSLKKQGGKNPLGVVMLGTGRRGDSGGGE